MLQKIRSKTHGAIAWIVIILIGFVFAIWGIEGYVSSNSNVVAEINGEVVTTQELQRTYEQLLRQQRLMQALQGGQPVNEEMIRQQALGGLVGEKILATTAREQGFAVSDQYVDELIRTLPQLQNEEGVYAPEKFDALLSNLGYTLPEFRKAAENDLIINQVRGSIVDSAFILSSEVDKAIKLLEQTRDVSYLLIPASEYLPQITISDEDAKTYYEDHASEFMLPERVSIEYIRLNADDLVIPEADDQTLEMYYTEHQAQYTEPEKRHAAHILLTTEKEGGDEASLNALAEKLIQQIKDGGDFAALAQEYSADPGSATKGGDLGWFGRGVMVAEFDQAVFSANEGDTVGPIKTQFGLHIIKVMGIQPETVHTFAEVKDKVRADWMNAERQSIFESQLAQLDSITFENPESLTPAATQLNLAVETSGFFTRDNTRRLGALDKSTIADAAFSEAVLLEDKNSSVIELKPTDVVVLRKTGYEEPQLESFDVVRDNIKNRLALEKAAKQAHTNAEAWSAELTQGIKPADLNVGQLKWVTEAKTNRYNFSVPPEVLDEAFRLPFSANGKTAIGMLPIAQNDYVIVMVNGKYDGELDPSVAEQMRADYTQGVLEFKGQLDYQLYTLQAQKDSDVDMVDMKM